MCLVEKEKIPELGKKLDIRFRTTRARADNLNIVTKVELAREVIYGHGLAVNSTKVETLLKPTSLVPTVVCFI
jgi:hypothetical protein